MRFTRLLLVSVSLLLASGTASAQERYSLFVPSDADNVRRMLDLAKLQDNDVIIDLGSGDGRIVLGAAARNASIRGIGVDLDAKLVAEASAAAQAQGLADRVQFIRQNAFDADLSKVTVITMWMWPEVQRMLRTKILAEARPGTRVLTNLWDLGSWKPDAIDQPDRSPVSMWVVPARVAGYWSWQVPYGGNRRTFSAVIEQQFQNAEGVVRVDNRRGVLTDLRLLGEEVRFNLGMTVQGAGYVRHEFSGRVQGDRITGTVRYTLPPEHDKPVELPWVAVRSDSSAWFAPTGLDAP